MNFEYFLIRITFLKIKKKIIKFYIEFVQIFFRHHRAAFVFDHLDMRIVYILEKKLTCIWNYLSSNIIFCTRV
jgi:hypothetical protein